MKTRSAKCYAPNVTRNSVDQVRPFLSINKALDNTEEALIIRHSPEKKSMPIIKKFKAMFPTKVQFTHYQTVTPRKRRLHLRGSIMTSTGEQALLLPIIDDTPPKISCAEGNPAKIWMPSHDPSIVSSLDIRIDYQMMKGHKSYDFTTTSTDSRTHSNFQRKCSR